MMRLLTSAVMSRHPVSPTADSSGGIQYCATFLAIGDAGWIAREGSDSKFTRSPGARPALAVRSRLASARILKRICDQARRVEPHNCLQRGKGLYTTVHSDRGLRLRGAWVAISNEEQSDV